MAKGQKLLFNHFNPINLIGPQFSTEDAPEYLYLDNPSAISDSNDSINDKLLNAIALYQSPEVFEASLENIYASRTSTQSHSNKTTNIKKTSESVHETFVGQTTKGIIDLLCLKYGFTNSGKNNYLERSVQLNNLIKNSDNGLIFARKLLRMPRHLVIPLLFEVNGIKIKVSDYKVSEKSKIFEQLIKNFSLRILDMDYELNKKKKIEINDIMLKQFSKHGKLELI